MARLPPLMLGPNCQQKLLHGLWSMFCCVRRQEINVVQTVVQILPPKTQKSRKESGRSLRMCWFVFGKHMATAERNKVFLTGRNLQQNPAHGWMRTGKSCINERLFGKKVEFGVGDSKIIYNQE